MALEQREKRLLAIPVALAGVLLFYNYVHVPLFARRAEAAQQADKVRLDLRRSQEKLTKEGNLTLRAEAVAAREQVVDAWVPGKNSAALFIWYLSQAELQSGVRIKGLKVGDRKLVAAKPQAQSGAQGAESQQADAQPAPAQPAGKDAPNVVTPMLTVVQLDLKVDARFAQHLLFSQALEETPLFLNTESLALARGEDEKADMEKVGKLVQEGRVGLAAQLLRSSPDLDGTYQINLYFKADKIGPATDPMHFTTEAGKNDPFVMDGVEEFLQALTKYYALQGEQNNSGKEGTSPGTGQQSPPVTPVNLPEQMG